jgi:uroporphyrinogen-III synthase
MADLPLYLFSLTPYPDTIHVPILSVRYCRPEIDFDRYDALVVTSKQAVDALEAMGPAWRKVPVLCVAFKTAEKVRNSGGSVLGTGGGYGENLEGIIKACYSDKRWLYARPAKAASDFAERLRQSGVAIDDAVVYETFCSPELSFKLEKEAVLAFSSPSAVECFSRYASFLPGHRVVVIGASTRAALPFGIDAQMPQMPTLKGLVALGRKLASVSARF